MRNEVKYRIEGIPWRGVENHVLWSPAGFQPIFHKRRVHNVYFDKQDMNAFYDNINGVSHRGKMRVRWYESQGQISLAKIEIKKKSNLLGTKQLFHIPNWDKKDFPELQRIVQEKLGLNEESQPIFYSWYDRSYYQSFNSKFRITIDTNMSFCGFGNNYVPLHPNKDHAVILELKYDKGMSSAEVDQITQSLPFQVTKNSKYARGVLLTRNF